jgi:hypothetical protein
VDLFTLHFKGLAMKKTLLALFVLIALSHTMACNDEIQQEEEETMLAYDPIPWANDGLGCITDSECEGVE